MSRDDDLDALRAAADLAFELRSLGEHERARELEEATLAHRRRILGDDASAAADSFLR